MKKKLLLFAIGYLLLIFVFNQAPLRSADDVAPKPPEKAAEEPKPLKLDSAIKEVIVYSNQAIVTRSGSSKFVKGMNTILLEGLPAGLNDASVRVLLNGEAAPQLVNIEVEESVKSEFRKEEAQKAAEKLEKLTQDSRKLIARQNDLMRQRDFLRSFNIGLLPDGSRQKPEPVPMNPESWGTMLEFVAKELSTVEDSLRKLEEETDDLNERIIIASAEARLLQSYKTTSMKNVFLDLYCAKDGAATIEVTYLIYGPAWYPRYDVIADVNTGKIDMIGYALVKQQTGEDWSNANIIFSAAEPSISAHLPQLQSWHLGVPPTPVLVAGKEKAKYDANKEYQDEKNASELRERKLEKAYGKVSPSKPSPRYASKKDNKQEEVVEQLKNAEKEISSLQKQVYSNQQRIAQQGGQQAQQRQAGEAGRAQDGGLYYRYMAENRDNLAPNSKTSKRQQQVQEIEGLVQEQGRALSQGDYRKFYDANNELKNKLESDELMNKTFNQYYTESLGNISKGERLLELQRWERNLIAPVRSSGGYDFRWKALRPETIPADGILTKAVIFRESFDGEFKYEAAPEVSQYVFLGATIVQRAQQPLLAGPGSVFLGSDFIGDTIFSTVASSEKLKLDLGVDEGISLKRDKDVKRDTRGGKYAFAHDISVILENHKRKPVAVFVYERIPVVADGESKVRVEDVKFTPEPVEQSKHGMITWKMELKPGEKQTIKDTYMIVHPNKQRMVLSPSSVEVK